MREWSQNTSVALLAGITFGGGRAFIANRREGNIMPSRVLQPPPLPLTTPHPIPAIPISVHPRPANPAFVHHRTAIPDFVHPRPVNPEFRSLPHRGSRLRSSPPANSGFVHHRPQIPGSFITARESRDSSSPYRMSLSRPQITASPTSQIVVRTREMMRAMSASSRRMVTKSTHRLYPSTKRLGDLGVCKNLT
jgi:hypothetical protein